MNTSPFDSCTCDPFNQTCKSYLLKSTHSVGEYSKPICAYQLQIWQETSTLTLLFSCYVVSDSLWHHGLQCARIPCPSLSLGVCSNSCSLSWWCHLNISSSVTHFSFCLQSFPASGFFFFPNKLALCIRWPTYWSFRFSISSSNEYSGLISFRNDWFDLLGVQRTLKSLL